VVPAADREKGHRTGPFGRGDPPAGGTAQRRVDGAVTGRAADPAGLEELLTGE